MQYCIVGQRQGILFQCFLLFINLILYVMIFTSDTVNEVNNNKAKLNSIAERSGALIDRQLVTLNRLRAMNGKQQVSSFAEHRELKARGL